MKKINISSQLILLFFSIVLIASCAFFLIAITRIKILAEAEIYSRLSTYVYLLNESNEESDYADFPDMSIAYYIKTPTETVVSDNLDNYFDLQTSKDMITTIIKNPNQTSLERGTIDIEEETIYYVCLYNSTDNYSFLCTDASYLKNMVRGLGVQIVLVFFILILLSIYIIYFWSNKFVKRVRLLQNHIVNLPRNKYEVSYNDDSLDEIGELTRSVEEMRKEIGHNEQIKQEMLQNLSHDFKTPIAVIKSYAEAQIDGMTDEESSRIIIMQADILKKKVNRLLQYNSLEYLSKDKEFEDINISELINEVVTNYKYLTNIEIELDLDNEVTFKCYRENMYTVIDNIFDNATRYAKTKIKVVLKKDRLRIYNDGEHIDEQFLNGIFKPYEKGSKGEFGLGMSIVKKTCDFFGLKLKVVNEEVGVSFIITTK